MRNAFIDELILAAEKNPKIALVVGDLGYGVVETFAQRFPRQFFNAGVAEQNMMGLSAGLASEGWHVFAYSIANFPTFRCAEQIRNDVAYHNLPVTIVAVGGGLSYGGLGYSHHAVQDFGLMRILPNMLIAAPGDPMEVRGCMRYLIDNPQPSYLRLGKAGEKSIHSQVPKILPGEWVSLEFDMAAGLQKKAIVTTGAAMQLVDQYILKDKNQEWARYSLPLWGMHEKTLQPSYVNKFERVVTIEEHLLDAGFGTWMMESLLQSPDLITRLKIKALDSKVCGMVGSQKTLNYEGGLDMKFLCE